MMFTAVPYSGLISGPQSDESTHFTANLARLNTVLVDAFDTFQMTATGPSVELHEATRVGNDPFDTERSGRCECGDVVGLNVLSEVSVRRAAHMPADLFETKELIGTRRGLLRPRPIPLMSAKAWKAIAAAKVRGLNVEVAHFV
jgi:hypothetical protein